MAAVAPCLLSQCQLPLAKCITNPFCAANLTCIIGCSGSPDERTCQIKCGDTFQNEVVDEFNACALSAKKCVPQKADTGPLPGDARWDPVDGRYPVPPPESITQAFDVTKMSGRWNITAGLNPLFDLFDCQVHFFEGTAPTGTTPGRLLGKINWRIPEPDGEFLTKSVIQNFVQTAPGVLENHGNEYLHYQDDWYVLDHDNEDDPENGFVLIYYRGRNDAWAGYGGGTLYTRARTVPPQLLDRVREATARIGIPYDKFWKATDNSCPVEGDPAKLRAQYAEKLLERAGYSAEAQLTYLSRTATTEVDKDEKWIFDGARRLEQMSEDFAKAELKALGRAAGKFETNLEQDELVLETPLRKLLSAFKR